MDVGIGLPSTIPGTDGARVIEWGRRAERAGFASVGTIDRIAFDNYEPLITLAAVAGVTERIRLITSIMIVPNRANAALLAKQAASVDRLSGGRLVLGMAVGGRDDDFTEPHAPMAGRGARFVAMLEEMREIWAGGGPIGPRPAKGGPSVIIGGGADVSFERAARYGDGWIAGGADPQALAGMVGKARAAWSRQGREGLPKIMALAYYALGPGARDAARTYLPDYYGFMGATPDMAEQMALTEADAVRGALSSFADAGCDELILFPCSAELDQVDLLAEAAFK